ncbi:MAG: transporter substrate-binding domain-containing protein [Verrucomicrobia bacterium]|nr:transporter substrate-binding domain-containing protein [Verrucomicrobiota bacterium]
MKKIVGLLFVVTLLAGCITQSVQPDPSVLRVGVSPRSQPMVFKQGDQIVGVEADFAHKLGEALSREVVFVEVPWNKQIDYLEQNKTDIIMSNMTITAPRSIRINFSTPYMQSGISALFRRDAYDPSGLLASTIINQNKRIGYMKNTTGEIFVMQRFLRGEKKSFSSRDAAVKALRSGKIDMFISGAPSIWWLSAINESALVAFPDVLNVEPLAWGVGKHNIALLDEVNALIAQWGEDGTSKKIIQNWIPSFK